MGLLRRKEVVGIAGAVTGILTMVNSVPNDARRSFYISYYGNNLK